MTDNTASSVALSVEKALARAQAAFEFDITAPREFCGTWLSDLLVLTQSEYGFVAEIHHRGDRQPYIKIYSAHDVSLSGEARALYEKGALSVLGFSDAYDLIKEVLAEGKSSIVNDLNEPSGYFGNRSDLESFLGLPIYFGDVLVGVIGLLNRPEGYDYSWPKFLSPLLAVYGRGLATHLAERNQVQQEFDVTESYLPEAKQQSEPAAAEERKTDVVQLLGSGDAGTNVRYLNESLVRVSHLLAAGPAVIYTRSLNENYPVSFVSENVKKLFGFGANLFLNNSLFWLKGIHPDDVDGVLADMSELFKWGQHVYEYRFCLPNGNYIWIRDEMRLIYSDDGHPTEVVGYWTNIDDRKQVEQELRESYRFSELLARYIAVTSGLSLQSIIETTLGFLKDQLGITHSCIAIKKYDAAGLSLYGLDSSYMLREDAFSCECNGPMFEFFNENETVYRPDLTLCDKPFAQNLIDKGIYSDLLVPLLVEGEYLGALCVASEKVDGFDDQVCKFIPLLGPSLSQAIQNVVLYDSLQQEKEKLKQVASEREIALESTRRFQEALDSTKDAIFLIDPDKMRFLDFNLSALKFTGYSRDELLALEPTDLKPEYSRKKLQSIFKKLVNGDMDFYDLDTVYRCKDGSLKPVEVRISPLHYGAGSSKHQAKEHPALVAMARDVSERKAAEKALHESELRFRSLVDQSPFSIQIFSPKGETLRVNPAWEKLWGTTIEELKGVNILEDPQLIEKGVMPYLKRGFSGEAVEIPPIIYIPDRDNEDLPSPSADRWIRAFIYPISNREGEIQEVILMHEDVTERRRVEEKLRQSAVVVENTAEAVLITDINNNIIVANKAFSEITGYSEEEVLGLNPRILKTDRHPDEFYDEMWNMLRQEGRWQGEIWDRRKNGEVFPAWYTLSLVRDIEGSVVNYVSVFSDITSIKQSQAQVDFLAYHDSLTGLPNRLLFKDRLNHAIRRANREGNKVAVLFLDLDRFKNINDSLGHLIGDKLIEQTAQRLLNLVREDDTVARLGGDEFIVAMEGVKTKRDVIALANKLMEAFSRPFKISGHELHVTLSMGMSLYPRDGTESETLIKNADVAMYRAKDEGRNNYFFYQESLSITVFERLTLETELRSALERNELVLHYQPQLSLDTGEVVGVEALVRWQHIDKGLIPPSAFIAMAEDSGLITALGEWVLREACTQMQAWLQAGYPLQRIAVNVSAIQLQRGSFIDVLKNVLDETGLPAQYLELEITESTIMQRTDWVISLLDQLKVMGISIAVDDFGTGYSSLSYLKRLPVNKLKIDRSFVQDIPEDTNDEAIARAVIALGKSLQLKVVAEGVETDEQHEFLRAQGCEVGQGWHYGKALPVGEVEKLLI